jgi:hypothetical protein
MKYRNFALIEYQGETEISENFNDILDKKNYIIIDKEDFARKTIEKHNDDINDIDDADWDIIVSKELSQCKSDILGILLEILYNDYK